MAELEDKSENIQNTESDPVIGKIINRLLKRKSGSGVVLPKIRSKIAKITHNADRIRENRLVLPGNNRREKIKQFSEKLIRKESANLNLRTNLEVKKRPTSWDSIDMLLPNGSSMEKSNPTFEQPSFGLPPGGQVIAPFNPPPVSDHEPSFIERRKARLKAQEEKKSQPQTKKADPSARLYSRVEEIHPQPKRKIDPAIELPNEKPGKILISKSEKDEGISDVKSSQPSQIKSSDKSNVVQRQPEIDHTPDPKVVNEKPQQEKLQQIQTDKSTSTIDEEPHTLKPSKKMMKSKEINEKTSLNDQQPDQRITSELQEEIKKDLDKSQRLVSKIPEMRPKEINKSKDNVEVDPQQIKDSISKFKEDEDHTIKGKTKGDLPNLTTTTPSIQRQKDENIGKQQQFSENQSKLEKAEEKEKLELPLALTSQPKRELVKEVISEKDEPTKEKNIHPKVEKQELSSEEISPTERSSKSTDGDQKTKDFEKSKVLDLKQQEDEKTALQLEKPLISPKIKKFTLIKPFTPKQQDKTEKITQILKKPVYKTTVKKPFLQSRKPAQIQRQFEVDSKDQRSDQKPELLQKKTYSTIDDQSKTGSKAPIQNGPTVITKGSSEQPKTEFDLSPTIKVFRRAIIEKRIGVYQERKQKKNNEVMVSKKFSSTLLSKKPDLPLLVKTSGSTNIKSDQSPNVPKDKMNLIQSDRNQEKTHLPKVSTSMSKIIAGEKILLTSPGRESIQRQVKKSNQDYEKIRTSESSSPLIVPFASPEVVDQSAHKGHKIDKQNRKDSIKEPISEKQSSRIHPSSMEVLSQKKPTVHSEKKTKSDLDLPVIQTQKAITQVPIYQPEQPVSGPIVQRMINSPEEDGLTQLDIAKNEKPDLEKLAKDVYPIIKRWIAIEKERTSGRLY